MKLKLPSPLAAALLLGALSLPSQAALTFYFYDSPDGVVMSYTGSLNSNAFGTPEASGVPSPVVNVAMIQPDGFFNAPDNGPFLFEIYDVPNLSSGVLPPFTGMASGMPVSLSNFVFLSSANGGEVFLDSGYISGSLLVGNALFENVTLADLGAPDGEYGGDLTSEDDVTIFVGQLPQETPIPEVSGSSVLLGMLSLSLFMRRRLK